MISLILALIAHYEKVFCLFPFSVSLPCPFPPSICLSMYLSVCLSVCLPAYLRVCLSVLSVCLFVCLPACLPVCYTEFNFF